MNNKIATNIACNMFQSIELQYLSKRGYLKQFTHAKELDELFLTGQKITFYIGFDCTARSFHIGHLIPIMIARYLTQQGHHAIIILGTVTAKIGDPSGKNEQRKILTDEFVDENYHFLALLIKKFLGEKHSTILKNDWLERISLVDFLRNYGVHFSVNRMLHIETFKNRIDACQPLSFLEFSYNLFQGYDFVHLNKIYNCILQIGGSDQWSNILSGIELGQKLHLTHQLFGVTTNLLLNAAGDKMGKSAQGAVWLDETMLSAFDYWQYFRNVDDKDVASLLLLLTDINEKQIEKILAGNINQAKIILANEVTAICHGLAAAELAAQIASLKFSKDKMDLQPDLIIPLEELDRLTLVELVKKFSPTESLGQIKRLIEQGAIKVNEQKILGNQFIVKSDSFPGGNLILEIGKKKKFMIAIS